MAEMDKDGVEGTPFSGTKSNWGARGQRISGESDREDAVIALAGE